MTREQARSLAYVILAQEISNALLHEQVECVSSDAERFTPEERAMQEVAVKLSQAADETAGGWGNQEYRHRFCGEERPGRGG